MDAVLIATPTHLHRQIALDAIASGKHVYLEAPIAHTVADAQALALAAKGSKAVVYAGFQARANPVYQRAVSLMGSDAMREPVSLYAQWHRKTSLRFPASEPGTDNAVNWRLDPASPPDCLAKSAPSSSTWRSGYGTVCCRRGSAAPERSGSTRMAARCMPTSVWADGVALHWQTH